jgi:hypothetical protein
VSVLRRAHIEVVPDTDGFDDKLKTQLARQDPGGKAGKQIGGQLNRALRRLDLAPIDVQADPRKALAAIDATEAKLRRLSTESATVEIKIQTERALGHLGRFRKQLGDIGDEGGAMAATGFATRFAARLGPLLASAGASPQVLAGAGVLGLAFAPSIAAGIGAGIAAGVGGGAIIAGIKLISKDPQVAAAGKDVGQRFAQGVTSEAETFKVPVLNALKEIDAFAGRTTPKIGAIFRNVSPEVTALTKNLTAAGDAIADSLVSASARSSGPLRALGDGVQTVGVEFGHMIDTLSQRGPEGTAAINDLTNAMTNAIKATTAIVDNAAKVKGWSMSVDDAIDSGRAWIEDHSALSKSLHDVGINLDLTADGYKRGSAAADLYRLGVIGAAGSLNDYDHWLHQASDSTSALTSDTFRADPPLRALVGTLTAADHAALGERNSLAALSSQLRGQADPVFALISAQNNLKTAQDKAAESVKIHGRNSEQAKTATRNLALAALDLQGKAGALGSTFSGHLTPQMKDTFKAAGLTKEQIHDVEKQFTSAKKAGDNYAKKYAATATLTGEVKVGTELGRLLAVQQALRSGNPLTAGSVNKAVRNILGPQINRARGGPIYGPGTETSDDIPIMASKNEWVVRASSAKKIGQRGMEYINKYGELPAQPLATGGLVRWPYPVNVSGTRIPSMNEVTSAVTPQFGSWPSSPSAQRGDSGVWRRILALVKASGIPYQFGNAYRPGDPKWHGSGRAIDFMGYNQDRLAKFFLARQSQVLELIHRTKSRDYGITRGHYNAMPTQWPLHRNHLHIAMDDGGFRTLQPGMNLVPNGTGRPEPIAGPAAMASMGGNTYNINVSVPPTAHPAEVGRQIILTIQAAERTNGTRWRQ